MTDTPASKIEPVLAAALSPAGGAATPLLQLEGVEVRYGGLLPVVPSLDLSVSRGDWVVFEGPVASGKSALLRVLAGREKPATGAVRIAGEDPFRLRPAARQHLRRSVGAMAPDLPLFPDEDAVSNVALVEWLGGASASQGRERALAALARVGLDPARCQGVASARLSAGECRLVALARALAHRPALLVLDDLLDDLDPARATQVVDVLTGFCDAGVGLVCSQRVRLPGEGAPVWPARARILPLMAAALPSPGVRLEGVTA
jgi:ABC-type ATPase involved in cell division